MAETVYVNPTAGSDSATGSQQAPLKTITQALKQVSSGSQIQLAEGYYNAASGEIFPLHVPVTVTIVGNESHKGSNVLIEGSGEYRSPTLAKQNVTFILSSNGAELRGITVTNQANRGVAVWIESIAATISNCSFMNCTRDGVLVSGNARVTITDSVFTDNTTNCISIVRDSQGEIRGNICYRSGFGMAIGDRASPTLIDNYIYENRSGIVISGDARPVLRNNISERNIEDGIIVNSNALPDLGNTNDYGGNILRLNGKFDLHNSGSHRLLAVGNQVDPGKIKGYVELVYNQAPTLTSKPTPVVTSVPLPLPTLQPTSIHLPISTTVSAPASPSVRNLTFLAFPPKKLIDIKNHWAEEFIQKLFKLEIIIGFRDRTFKPDATITRSQYAALVVKAFNPQSKRQAVDFKDVPGSFWAYKAIQQAYEGLFISAFSNNVFRPHFNMKRLQILVSLVNGLELSTDNFTANNVYTDWEKVPESKKKEIVIATLRRMVVNFPNPKHLNPNRDATRAEVAVMVYQALVDAEREEPIDSPYIM
jgi:parallel beta-helix repeat protein